MKNRWETDLRTWYLHTSNALPLRFEIHSVPKTYYSRPFPHAAFSSLLDAIEYVEKKTKEEEEKIERAALRLLFS
jgi:hypothetical protein